MRKKEEDLGQRVVGFIRKRGLISAGDTLVVAVSGGADSVCLLHILARWQAKLQVKLHAAHLDHQLRADESEADAEYVSFLADMLGIPVTIGRRDVTAYRNRKRCSLEEAAREVRYSFLAEVARTENASSVAVGHTRDDQVETILMHLLRGTGPGGLRGLQPSSSLQIGEDRASLNVVRPLLDVPRQETLDYCHRCQLKPRSDPSNLSTDFFRNRIRLDLLPVLETYNPRIDAALLRLATIAADEVSFIEEQASRVWNEVANKEDGIVYLDKDKMGGLSPAIQRQLFRMAVMQLLDSLKDIEADHIEAMVGVLAKPAGKRLRLPRGLRLFTEYKRLILTVTPASLCPFPSLENTLGLTVPGETALPGWLVKADILHGPDHEYVNSFTTTLDLDRAGTELVVRKRKPGDRFQPLGMNQPKKLQDFMVDARIPRTWRSRVPLLCSPEQILWVVGWRIDDRVKVTASTRRVLRLKFERSA